MVQRADEQCFHSQRVRPYDVMVPGEMLRPGHYRDQRERDPAWTRDWIFTLAPISFSSYSSRGVAGYSPRE